MHETLRKLFWQGGQVTHFGRFLLNKNCNNIVLVESLSGSFLFGLKMTLFSKFLINFSGFSLAWISTFLGGIILMVRTFLKRKLPRKLPIRFWMLIITSGITKSIAPMFQFMALERSSGILVNFLFNFVGIVTILSGILVNHEKPNWIQYLGALVTCSGLIVFFEKFPTGSDFVGVIYIFISIVCVAINNSIVREQTKFIDVWNKLNSPNLVGEDSTLALSTLLGGTVLLILGLVFDRPFPKLDAINLMLVLYNAIFGIVISSLLWFSILRKWEAYKASLFTSISVIWTLLFSVLIFGEKIVLRQVLGISVMLCGLWMINRFSFRPKTSTGLNNDTLGFG